MKKIFVLMIILLSFNNFSSSEKISNPQDFVLREIIPKELKLLPSEQYMNNLYETAAKIEIEVYSNNNWDETQEKTIDNNMSKVSYYYSEGKLGKIIKEFSDDKSQQLEIYYLKEGEPLYIITKNISNDELAKVHNVDELAETQQYPILSQRHYFVDNKLYHIFDNEDCGAPWHEDYLEESEKELRNMLKALLPK